MENLDSSKIQNIRKAHDQKVYQTLFKKDNGELGIIVISDTLEKQNELLIVDNNIIFDKCLLFKILDYVKHYIFNSELCIETPTKQENINFFNELGFHKKEGRDPNKLYHPNPKNLLTELKSECKGDQTGGSNKKKSRPSRRKPSRRKSSRRKSLKRKSLKRKSLKKKKSTKRKKRKRKTKRMR